MCLTDSVVLLLSLSLFKVQAKGIMGFFSEERVDFPVTVDQ